MSKKRNFTHKHVSRWIFFTILFFIITVPLAVYGSIHNQQLQLLAATNAEAMTYPAANNMIVPADKCIFYSHPCAMDCAPGNQNCCGPRIVCPSDAPTPSCIPEPRCVATGQCMLAQPAQGWCPAPSIWPSPSVMPSLPPVTITPPPPGCYYRIIGMCAMACYMKEGRTMCPPCNNKVLVCPSGTPPVTPNPSVTCVPPPPCVNANPRCLLAEPKNGWCLPSTSPQPTITMLPPTPNTSLIMKIFNMFFGGK